MNHPRQVNLDELIEQQRSKAAASRDGRSAVSIFGGGGKQLGQVLLTLTAGGCLPDHQNPGDATVQVLEGEVTLSSQQGEARLAARDYAVVPHATHRLDAHVDSVVLLTVHRDG
ncbi:LuxR family transcriptional regulator [Calidifontibacter indicus]|uniref:LuxR family transcriptional regulator n=1 Tax=Calidifontibacter indicus TaxID=419650 RepID=UPI003D71038A